MKINFLIIIFFSICLLSTAATSCFAQDETAYKRALSEASKQLRPSSYRADAFRKYLKTIDYSKMSEPKLNQFVADKMEELIAIDFWAAYLVQLYSPPDFIKWREIRELLSAEHVSAFEKLTEYCASHNCPKQLPADFPKAGTGWVKKDASSVLAKTSKDKKSQPSTAVEYGNLAADQLNQRKYNQAIQNASECLRLDKRIIDCNFVRGVAFYATGKYDSAISDLTLVIQADSKNTQAFEFRAESFAEKENFDAAIADFNASLALVSNPETLKRRDSIKIRQFFILALGQLNQGKIDESIKTATECLRIDKKIHGCYQIRASAYYVNQNLEAAISDLTQYIQLRPNESQGYEQRGEIYLKKKNYEAAISDLTKALDIKFDSKLKQRLEQAKEERSAAVKKP